jgi:hypothetical protein
MMGTGAAAMLAKRVCSVPTASSRAARRGGSGRLRLLSRYGIRRPTCQGSQSQGEGGEQPDYYRGELWGWMSVQAVTVLRASFCAILRTPPTRGAVLRSDSNARDLQSSAVPQHVQGSGARSRPPRKRPRACQEVRRQYSKTDSRLERSFQSLRHVWMRLYAQQMCSVGLSCLEVSLPDAQSA